MYNISQDTTLKSFHTPVMKQVMEEKKVSVHDPKNSTILLQVMSSHSINNIYSIQQAEPVRKYYHSNIISMSLHSIQRTLYNYFLIVDSNSIS